MVYLNLTKDEVGVLVRTLEVYLRELRMEIRDTENWNFKEELKRDGDVLNHVLNQLKKNEKEKPSKVKLNCFEVF